MSSFRSFPLSSELEALYVSNPAKFQRLLWHLIIPRFKIQRLHIGNIACTAYIDTVGEVVDSHKKKYATLTEWYNSVAGTEHKPTDSSVLAYIGISKRINILSIFSIAEKKEIEGFKDVKFRTLNFYTYVYRQIRSKELALPWSRDYTFDVQWKDQKYNIQYSLVKRADGHTGIDMLDAFETERLTDLFWKDESNELWALVDSAPAAAPEPHHAPHPIPHSEIELEIRLKYAEEQLNYQHYQLESLQSQVAELSQLVQQQHNTLTGNIQGQRGLFPPLVYPIQ